jgi:putative mRNA 3-end processing factor
MVNLLTFTEKGIYCPQGQFYIDPWRPVDRAVITHAHSDHARVGSSYYLCHRFTKALLQTRLGDHNYQSVEWDEPVFMNGVKISLHPSGHIIGSAQIRVEYKDEIWVVSGDYKTEDDGLSGAFQPIPCHVFITESTFGLPIYDWRSQEKIFKDIQQWVMKNKAAGKNSVLIAYSIGKAQRLLPCLSAIDAPIFLHGAVWNIQEALLRAGFVLPHAKRVEPEQKKDAFKAVAVIAPPGAEGSPWIKRFTPYEVGICSGWMQVRGNIRRSSGDAGFALSDHADWKGLLQAIKATGAQRVFVTHGFQSALSRYLREQGLEAAEIKTEFGEEEPASIVSGESETDTPTTE